MTSPTTDVLIVGAGPVGTALAIDLTRRGVSVRIIDKAETAFCGSRAKGLQPRTLEVLDDLGALDDVLARGSDYPVMGLHVGPFTVPLRMLRSPYAGDDTVPHPHTWLSPQFSTDRALHDRLNHLGVKVEYHHELTQLTQTPDAVTVSTVTPTGTETITARYVVGADGGASAVRKNVGIEFTGSTDEADRMLIFDADVTDGLSRNRWHVWPGRRGRLSQFTGACPLPHGEQFQWMIKLNPGEDPPVGDDQTTACIRARTGNKRLAVHNITWTSVWRPNTRLAQSYRRARVFLAGDAAHVHPPAGAQGLNTGVQDAYNLGWKLGQVLAGAPSELLDTYQAERQPIAAAVLGLATKKYDGMAKLDPSSLTRGKDEQQIALSYRGGPLAAATAHTTTLHVGDRAPDATLQNSSGTPLPLFDLYRGPHFTALAVGARAAQQLHLLAWPQRGAELRRVTIDAPAGDSADTHNLRDNAGKLRAAYGIDTDALFLIRPDGYIASIATGDLHATTTSAIAAIAPPIEDPADKPSQR